jgi:hypothetical protein
MLTRYNSQLKLKTGPSRSRSDQGRARHGLPWLEESAKGSLWRGREAEFALSDIMDQFREGQ